MILILIFLFFIALATSNDQCYDDLNILFEQKNQTVNDDKRYYVEKETLHCFKNQQALEKLEDEEPTTCPSTFATLNVSPIKVIPDNRQQFPYMTVNITIDVLEETEWVFLQFECLQASDIEDGYCHNKGNLIRYNRKVIQPCRALRLNKSKPILPFRFAYNCFRIFGFSQYRINVTFYPRNCRSNVLFTSPSIGEIYPDTLQIYQSEKVTIDQLAEWSPLLVVDSTESDGVWLRFATPSNYSWKEMKISIAERTSETKMLRIVEEFLVSNPATGVKWLNAPSGDYTAFAYIQRHDCSLICKERELGCRVCAHTPLNFTLYDHKASVPWKTLRAVRDAGFYVILILLGIVVAVGVGGFAVLTYIRRRDIKNPRSYELTERPNLLLIFADDCQEHTNVVLQLSASLEKLANARVLVDQEELLVSGEKPSRWLVSSLASASKVLIIVSPSVSFLLRSQDDSSLPQKTLIQRRPFPDLFATAIDMITSEISIKGARERFAIVRLPYSPPTPPHLTLLGLPAFELPTDLVPLTSFLHGVQATRVSHPNEKEERLKVNDAIQKFVAMSTAQPNWLNERLVDKRPETTRIEIEDLPYQRETSNNSSLKNSDEGLGLMEPPESDEEFDNHNHHKSARIQLLEPSDSE